MKFQYKWLFLPIIIIIFSSYVQLLINQIDTLAKLVTCLKNVHTFPSNSCTRWEKVLLWNLESLCDSEVQCL